MHYIRRQITIQFTQFSRDNLQYNCKTVSSVLFSKLSRVIWIKSRPVKIHSVTQHESYPFKSRQKKIMKRDRVRVNNKKKPPLIPVGDEQTILNHRFFLCIDTYLFKIWLLRYIERKTSIICFTSNIDVLELYCIIYYQWPLLSLLSSI